MAKLTPTSVFKSASGMEMPVFGLGTWQSRDEDIERALNSALEIGYRLIDTAYVYKNEHVIGKVLSQWFSSGKIKREDLFITTKLPSSSNNPKLVRTSLEKSLKDLQLDYVDLYLIHNPMSMIGELVVSSDGNINYNTQQIDHNADLVAVWKEMENMVDTGLAKAIGISKFSIEQIQRILKSARIQPANQQLELYLYNQCKDMQEFCRSKGITITSFGTLGSMGAPDALKTRPLNPLVDPVVNRIAKAHGKTPAQVLLRHLLQCGLALIPKSSNPDRLRQNIEIFDFELTSSEMAELNGLDKGEEGRLFVFENMKSHPEYPFPK